LKAGAQRDIWAVFIIAKGGSTQNDHQQKNR
jgi:hypothetical protein